MARGAGEVPVQGVAPLFVGLVDYAERYDESAGALIAGLGQAAVLNPGETRQQPVQRGRIVQGRQPYLVCGRALAFELADDDIKDGVGQRVVSRYTRIRHKRPRVGLLVAHRHGGRGKRHWLAVQR